MNVQSTKFAFLLVFLFVAIPLLAKDLFQFDLRDYDMSWGMTKEEVIKLKKKEIIENGTKIIFKDDKGKKWEGYFEYDDKGELFKIWFNIIDEAKPKNYKEYQAVKKLFVSKYRFYVKRLIELYGSHYLSTEIDDHGHTFEHRIPGFTMNSYISDWIYQFYTVINLTFDGSDKYGFELVAQFMSYQGYIEDLRRLYK